MPAVLTTIITVRVSLPVAKAIEAIAIAEGHSISEVVRVCLENVAGQVANKIEERRHVGGRLASLNAAATDLRRMAGLYAYALKGRRPVSDAETESRIAALEAVREAARQLVAP